MEITERILSPQEQRIEMGEEETLTTQEARIARVRVHKMLKGFRDKPPRVDVERARLLTESFRETEDLPLVMRWAKALEHILSNIPIYIGPDESIVGRFGPPGGRYGLLYPELRTGWLSNKVLKELSVRKGGTFTIMEEDINILKAEIAPYWNGKTTHEAIIRLLPEDTRRLMWYDDDIYTEKPVIRDLSTANTMMNACPNYERALKKGFNGIKKEAEERLMSLDVFNSQNNYEKIAFLKAVIIVCNALITYGKRHAELATSMAEKEINDQRKKELLQIAEICEWVPGNPARTFHEAIQCQWFVQVADRFNQRGGSWFSQGRIDQYLYPYYKKDIEEGRLTKDKTLELLECLWLNLAQYVRVEQSGTVEFNQGYSHWEATTIGGQTGDGRDASNELSSLILESKKEFPLDYPDLVARIHSQTPETFLQEVCDVIKEGQGFPKLLNDEAIIPQLLANGAPLKEARDYMTCGCSEVRMSNLDTYFVQNCVMNPAAALEMVLNNGVLAQTGERLGVSTGDATRFGTFDDVWNAFRLQIENLIRHDLIKQRIAEAVKPYKLAAPLFSCLHELCMKNCVDILQGDIKGGYSVGNFNVTGFGTVVDSLAAIKKLVYDDKCVTMGELVQAITSNFEGKEALRQMCLNAPKYGNNDPYVDSIGYEFEDMMCSILDRYKTLDGGKIVLTWVGVTANVPMGATLGATPDGRKAGEPLSDNTSPTQGRDTRGPTVTLLSVRNTKASGRSNLQSRLLNMKLSPGTVAGEEGTKRLASLIRTWCDMKHWHIQFNIINNATLRAAQKDPEKYRNLLVRVAGYSAYFVDLSPALQNEIMARTEHQSAKCG